MIIGGFVLLWCRQKHSWTEESSLWTGCYLTYSKRLIIRDNQTISAIVRESDFSQKMMILQVVFFNGSFWCSLLCQIFRVINSTAPRKCAIFQWTMILWLEGSITLELFDSSREESSWPAKKVLTRVQGSCCPGLGWHDIILVLANHGKTRVFFCERNMENPTKGGMFQQNLGVQRMHDLYDLTPFLPFFVTTWSSDSLLRQGLFFWEGSWTETWRLHTDAESWGFCEYQLFSLAGARWCTDVPVWWVQQAGDKKVLKTCIFVVPFC